MKRTRVYLNESQDVVPLKNATWVVEAEYDRDGNVIREQWSKLIRVRKKTVPRKRGTGRGLHK
jgi:hypothetical protein